MPETKKAPVAAAKKPVQEEIKLDLPEGPKVKFEVSAEEPEDADAPTVNEADDFDDDDDDSWLQGKDRKAAGGKNQPMSMKKQQQALAKKEPKKEKDVKKDAKKDKDAKKESAKPVAKAAPAAPAKPAAPAPVQRPVTRVGGLRAGFSSVSMKTATTMKIMASQGQPAAAPKPTVTMSVNTREISVRGAVVVK